MKNIIDYTSKKIVSFDELAFNNVDSLILSTIVYLDYSLIMEKLKKKSIKIKDVPLSLLRKGTATYRFSLYYNLFKNLKNNSRYNELIISNIFEVNNPKYETHFKAMSFQGDNFAYVSFMGTGTRVYDWKEDFNMAYNTPVPAQKLGVYYLNNTISKLKGNIYVGGHSKGGNLAVYSSIYTNILSKYRIKRIFNHDGPGFVKNVYKTFNYKLIRKKVIKTVTSSSVFGMLFLNDNDYKIIKSSGISIIQHNPFNWQIKNNDFVYLQDRTIDSKYIDKTIKNWISELSPKEIKLFINTVFDFLDKDIDISINNWFNILKAIYKGNKNMDDVTREKMDIIYTKFKYHQKENFKKISEL